MICRLMTLHGSTAGDSWRTQALDAGQGDSGADLYGVNARRVNRHSNRSLLYQDNGQKPTTGERTTMPIDPTNPRIIDAICDLHDRVERMEQAWLRACRRKHLLSYEEMDTLNFMPYLGPDESLAVALARWKKDGLVTDAQWQIANRNSPVLDA
jgi:hypothetical protein